MLLKHCARYGYSPVPCPPHSWQLKSRIQRDRGTRTSPPGPASLDTRSGKLPFLRIRIPLQQHPAVQPVQSGDPVIRGIRAIQRIHGKKRPGRRPYLHTQRMTDAAARLDACPQQTGQAHRPDPPVLRQHRKLCRPGKYLPASAGYLSEQGFSQLQPLLQFCGGFLRAPAAITYSLLLLTGNAHRTQPHQPSPALSETAISLLTDQPLSLPGSPIQPVMHTAIQSPKGKSSPAPLIPRGRISAKGAGISP